MKSIAIALFAAHIVLTSACTSLQPQEASPEALRRRIVTEDLLVPGERVRIVAADDTVHKFQIVSVDLEQATVYGKTDSVPFTEIVAVETREFAVGKTAALAFGAPTGLLIAIFLSTGFMY